MRKFNEWRDGVEQTENSDVLLDKIQNLVHQLEVELDSFTGDRFEGFLELIGGMKTLKRTLAEVQHGCVGDTPRYSTNESFKKMKKVGHKEVMSKGTRNGEKDLSNDYKGHLKSHGDVEPFKVVK